MEGKHPWIVQNSLVIKSLEQLIVWVVLLLNDVFLSSILCLYVNYMPRNFMQHSKTLLDGTAI